jgi:cell wall-associated NlpC family hydrolase
MRQLTSLEFLPKLIGIPYEEKDCWDIVKDFYAYAFGVDLSAYDIVPQDIKANEGQIERQKVFFEKTKNPQMGDIILFTVLGHNAHVGVYLDQERFLHSKKTIGCVVERFGHWENRIEGIYKWPELK